ncbi:MAG: hypothetical protein M1812_004286 [Candelaria pacifica]|nr:MAG: hypothetical protein M1812_004286 [Candelaria pacifica]
MHSSRAGVGVGVSLAHRKIKPRYGSRRDLQAAGEIVGGQPESILPEQAIGAPENFMHPLLLRVEALGSQSFSRACPSGTSSSIISRRLRHFQPGHLRDSDDQLHPLRTTQHHELTQATHEDSGDNFRPSSAVRVQRTFTPARLPSAPRTPPARERVLLALQQKNPDKLLHAFLQACRQTEFIKSIPLTTFTAIFRLLDPRFFVRTYLDLHHEISAGCTAQLGIKPIQDIFAKYVRSLGEITRRRRLAGYKLGIIDYTFLLKCASAVGDGDVAEGLWRDMKWDGVVPDATCYNHFFAAKCWSGLYHPARRHRIRIIPYHMLMREAERPKEGSFGFQAGSQMGVKEEILQEFDRMVQSGLLGDERTFTLLMTAMAREGDTNGVKAILNKVWRVDVDAILGDQEAAQQPVWEYPKTSPLHPGPDLLMTVAHVFGCNNDVPTAIRIVDHISRAYSITIPLHVWSHLLEWAFILAVPRWKTRKQDPGRLPKRAVSGLWQTMVGEPYNIRPTMPMYNREIKNLANRAMLKQMLELMEEGRLLYLRSIQKYRRSRVEYLHAKRLYRTHRSVLRSTTPIDKLWRKVQYNEIVKKRNMLFVKRWVRFLFARQGGWRWFGSHMGRGKDAYTRRKLPRLIDQWRAFLPKFIRYNTPEGYVKFNSRPTNVTRYRYFYPDELAPKKVVRYLYNYRQPRETLPEADLAAEV